CGDGGVDRSGAGLLLRHMQLITTKILARRRIRRPAEEGREHSHVPNVVPLGVFGEPARRHVVNHALAQRADGLVGHGKLLSRMGWNPTILRQGRAFRLSLLARPLRPLAAPTARAVSSLGGTLPSRSRRYTTACPPTCAVRGCDLQQRFTSTPAVAYASRALPGTLDPIEANSRVGISRL